MINKFRQLNEGPSFNDRNLLLAFLIALILHFVLALSYKRITNKIQATSLELKQVITVELVTLPEKPAVNTVATVLDEPVIDPAINEETLR